MKFAISSTVLWVVCLTASASASSTVQKKPYVSPKALVNGEVKLGGFDNEPAKVLGCCDLHTITDDNSCVEVDDNSTLNPVEIGAMPQFSEEEVLAVLESSKNAWDGGAGAWPQMSMNERIERIELVVSYLRELREEIVNVLMWEIGKNLKDAQAEIDRTIVFIEQVIAAIKDPSNTDFNAGWQDVSGTRAFVRRAAIGIMLCLGPFNYPLNETYATLIPALLMGNVVVMKIPAVGGLVHLLAMEAFSKALPPGAINFVSGGGRKTLPPLMSSGSIDVLAFIGGSRAADILIRQHPEPHRLKVFLQLEAKNMGIFLDDIFAPENAAALDRAIEQAVTGTLSYNGQRCTALKVLFVPRAHAEMFANRYSEKIDELRVGLPWQTWGEGQSQITPLPNQGRVSYMKDLIADATERGAKIINTKGGVVVGGNNSTLMVPCVLYPVHQSMKIYDEEQFGPVIPIVPYDDVDSIKKYARDGKYGQQASIFTTNGNGTTAGILDAFATVFGKININSQCGRSPDTLPFAGRRSSAMGVMSVMDSLKEFSVPTVISYKLSGADDVSEGVAINAQSQSKFMKSII